MLRLICDETGQVIELKQDSISIGRKEGLCDVQVQDQSISGLHCQIEVSSGSRTATASVVARIYDLQSLNGTWVNGKRVSESDLHEADRLQIGAVTFRVATADLPVRVLERPRGATRNKTRNKTRKETERLDDADNTSSLTVEIEIFGMIVGPMDVALVASSVASGEFSRTDKARIVGQRDWMQVGALLQMLNLDPKEAEPPAELAQSPVEISEPSDDVLIESPVSILNPEVPEMSSPDGAADNAPPVIAEVPHSPKFEPRADPRAAFAAARASVQPRVVVGKSDPSWSLPSGLSIPPLEASPKHIGAVLGLLGFVYLIFFGFGGETSARLPLYGEIQGAGECSGTIVFRPGPELKAPSAIAEIFKGRYFFTKDNGPLPGAYDVVIELSDLPASNPQSGTPTEEGQRPGTAPDPFSAAPPAAQMTAPKTVSAESDLKLNFQFLPNS